MVTALIQARMSSTRLANKALLKIGKEPMLYHVVKQTKASKLVKDVIIATTKSPKDKKIVKFCEKYNLKYFCGSNNDVLDRYFKCAEKFSCDPIIRISSDCPFIDPKVIDQVISKFQKNSYDYVSNNIKKNNGRWQNSTCNFPQGMVVEICNYKTLEKTWKNAKKPSEREHVFPYVQFNARQFKKSNILYRKDFSFIRCTVDKKEDLKFVREVWKRFPKSKKIIGINDILKIVKKEPDLVEINNQINFEEGYKKSVQKDEKYQKNMRESLKKFDFGIRVDMGGVIGSGHIYRSSALADELIKNGKSVIFIVKNKKNFQSHTQGKKYQCIDLKTSDDEKCIRKCKKLSGIKNLILDLQKGNEKYAKKLKNYFFIISIDDEGKKKIYSDVLINGQIGKFNYNYSFKNSSNIHMLGTDYIILRNSFYKLNKEFFISKKPIKKILLAFGGSDDQDVIRKILPFLISKKFHLTVILGTTYPYSNEIFKLSDKHKNLHVKKSLTEVTSIYLKNDLVIASSGMTSYELACLGIPSLFIPSGDHQYKIANEFMKKGFGVNYGFWDENYDHFSRILTKFSNYSFRKKMNKIGKTLVDGKGVFRIAENLIKLHSNSLS